MDPVTLGLTAAALLASKFGEGFAKDAGSAAWNGVKRLRDTVAAKFKGQPDAETTLQRALAEPHDTGLRVSLAERIATAATDDAEFRASLAEIVEQARRDPSAQTVIAQATDQARQVNIAGDNHGGITL
jgi:Flp pilus assembly protein TadD